MVFLCAGLQIFLLIVILPSFSDWNWHPCNYAHCVHYLHFLHMCGEVLIKSIYKLVDQLEDFIYFRAG